MQSQSPQLTSFIDEGLVFVQRLVFYTSEEAERREEIEMKGELEWNKFISGVLF